MNTTTTRSVAFRNGWIFSAERDLALFMVPVVVSFGLFFWSHSASQLIAPLLLVLLFNIVDSCHIFPVLFRSYFDSNQRRRHRALLIGLPLGLTGIMYGLVFIDFAYLKAIATYFLLYHHCGQQHGWIAISSRKGGDTHVVDRYLNMIAIFNVIAYPFFWWHFHQKGFEFFLYEPYNPAFPKVLLTLGTFIYWTINAAFIGRQIQIAVTERRINLAKYFIFISSAFVYYFAFVLSRNAFEMTALIIMFHGVPYIGLVYYYGKNRWGKEQGFPAVFFKGKRLYLYLVFLLLLTAGWMASYEAANFIHDQHWGPSQFYYFIPLLIFPSMMHYALDTFVWRRRFDNSLAQNLKFSF